MKCHQCQKEQREMRIFVEVRQGKRKNILLCKNCVMQSGYVWNEGAKI